jgi:hypothetical protein
MEIRIQSEIKQRVSGDSIMEFIFFCAVFILCFFYFKYLAFHRPDYMAHFYDVKHVVHGSWSLPHIGFEYITYYLSKLSHLSINTVGILFIDFCFSASVYIVYWLLRQFLSIPASLAMLSTVGLFIVCAIYVPVFNKNIYLGQGSPNVWHNPTLIILKPFSFLLTYLTICALDLREKKEYWLWICVLLFLTMIFKPVFWLVYIPALFIYITLTQTKNLKVYLLATVAILPCCILALYQYHLMQIGFDKQSDGGSGVIISVFGVLHLYTPNVFISLLLAIGFPLAMAIFRFKAVFANKYLQFIWIMLVVGWIQMAFLAERGHHFGDGNFFWGYIIILHLLFVFSFIEYFKWLFVEKIGKNFVIRIEQIGVSLLLFAHFVSGIIYLISNRIS